MSCLPCSAWVCAQQIYLVSMGGSFKYLRGSLSPFVLPGERAQHSPRHASDRLTKQNGLPSLGTHLPASGRCPPGFSLPERQPIPHQLYWCSINSNSLGQSWPGSPGFHLVHVLTLGTWVQWHPTRCSPPLRPSAISVLVLLFPSGTPPEPAPEIHILLVQQKASETGSQEAEL